MLLQGHVIVPSWDSVFDDDARLYLANNFCNWQPFVIPEPGRWNLPPWLRQLALEQLPADRRSRLGP